MAVPFALGMIFNTMFNVTDTFFAGRLSTDSLAALSLSFPMYFIIFSPGVGIQSGAAALISNALGAGRTKKAVCYQVQAITLGAIVAVVLSVGMYLVLPFLYGLFGADGEVLAGGLRYMRVISIGGFALIGNSILNAGLVARGDTKAFRNVLLIMAVINVGLDPLLMFGLELGGVQVIPRLAEAGTALATILLQSFGIFYLIGRGRKHGVYEGAKPSDFIPDRECFREIIGQSAPATLDFVIMTLGAFVINFFIARYGRNPIAAYGTALRIEQIALLPLFGIATALATLVGQNNGANRMDRVKESFSISIRYSVFAAVAILTPVLLAAPALLRLFTDTAEVVRIGRTYLYIQGITYFSYILMNLSNAMLRGLKKPAMIMWVGLYRQLAAPFLVFPLLAIVFGMEQNGVFWGLVIVNWSAAVFTYFYSKRKLSEAEEQSGPWETEPAKPESEVPVDEGAAVDADTSGAIP